MVVLVKVADVKDGDVQQVRVPEDDVRDEKMMLTDYSLTVAERKRCQEMEVVERYQRLQSLLSCGQSTEIEVAE